MYQDDPYSTQKQPLHIPYKMSYTTNDLNQYNGFHLNQAFIFYDIFRQQKDILPMLHLQFRSVLSA